MSLKDLFLEENKAEKSLLNVSAKTLVESKDLESENFLHAYSKDKRRIIPDLDLSDPKNFARFGRAELYYEKAFEHIQNYYPYDGSDYEKLAFQNSGSLLDMYILDKQYPKSTGFVSFGKDIAYDGSATTFSLKNTTSPEFIFFKGGPNQPLSGYSAKDDISLSKANVYDESKLRTSNLSLNMASGSTIEFWMKKTEFAGSSNEREIIFDLWNSASISDVGVGGTYGRLNVSCKHGEASKIFLHHRSGSIHDTLTLDTGLSTIADSTWHHYAVSVINSSSDLVVDLFVDGDHKDRSVGSSKATNEIIGAMQATLGAAVTQMAGDLAGGIGYGKMSGSIDDFRYFKKRRINKEVQRNWKNHVPGGTNTDEANTELGVYYKFNEGITGTSSIDQTVLDYSGRVTNATFTGYDASFSRSTGSAFEESGNNIFEPKDPIIYSFHPDVLAQVEDLKSRGRAHDHQNTSLIEHMIPSWIIEEEQSKDGTATKHLLQVMAFYFDELSMQMTAHKDLKNVNYISGSITGSYTRPLPYARRLLNSHGFIAPEIFTQAEHIENLQNKNDDFAFTGSLDEIKNVIYGNIYNNLLAIQKSKGTSRSIQNLLHCIGIDEDIFKINLYSSGAESTIENNFKTRAIKTRSLDFAGKTERSTGTAYQYVDAENSNSQNFISGTFDNAKETSLGYSVEAEVIFPLPTRPGSLTSEKRFFNEVTSSIFGQHTAIDNITDNDLTFNTTDHSHFSVFSVRPESLSTDAKIVVTGSEIGYFETEIIKDLYNGGKYNIAFTMLPGKPDFINSLSGASIPADHGGMTASILVTSTNYDNVSTLVTQSNNITFAKGADFLKRNKRIYIGSHYTNFTGAILQRSDVKINSCRVWLHNLDQETVIAHNRDLLSFGALRPNKNLNTTVSSLQGLEVPADRTLALHWNFSTNSTSDASGQMLILDESSGSLPNSSAYGWVGTLTDKFHTARADFFPVNDSNIIDIDYISTARQQLPEAIDSDDMTQILSGSDDVIFTKESRPIDYVFSIEKSFYQSVSEELINFFATIDDFHNLIGQPVNRYRQEYKDLGKLRQLLFQKFEDIADVEKYVNYYKWFDSSIVKMIENLIPVSARFTKGVSNVIESHVLERNKYWNKFPTLEMRHDPPEGTIKGREELQYRWQFGHAPPPTSQATATFIAVHPGAGLYTSRKFSLQSTDGTTKTYRFNNNASPATGELTSDEVNITINGLSDQDSITEQVVAAVTGSTGHNGKILTTRSTTTATNDTVLFTQEIPGDAGNTPITLTFFHAATQTFNGGATNTSFSGGESPGQNQNCLWYSERAEKTTPLLATSNASVNSDRQTIMEAIVTDVSGSGNQVVKYNADGTRTKYQAFRYANRSLLRHQDLVTDHLNHPNRRNQPHENKKYLYWRQAVKFTPPESQTSSSLVIAASSIVDGRTDCLDQDDLPTASFQNKFKYKFTTQHSINNVLVEGTLFKGRATFPFSIYSGSGHSVAVPGTYAKQLSTFKTDIEINNLHHDQVHPKFRDAPLQSPFTEHHVGGNFYRHVAINSASAGRIGGTGSAGTNTPALSEGLHSSGSRPEGWALEIDANNIKLMSAAEFYDKSTPRAGGFVFRDQAAKRPLNIKNILVTTASNQGALGNYSKGYQIFQSSNRKTNDLWFRSGSDGSGGFTFNELQSPFLSGNYDYELPVRTRNEHIFVERFSAPGGAEVMSRGFLDPESEQFSLYNSLNNRNLNLRRALQGTSGSLLSNHTTVGGFDSYFGAPTASFHKTHRNTQHAFKKVPVVVSVKFNSVADPSDLENFQLTLTSSNGTARAYKFEEGSGGATGDSQGSGVITVQLNGITTPAAMAAQLKAAINDSSGHGTDGLRFTVVLATTSTLNDTVVIAQAVEPSVTSINLGEYTASFGVVHANDPQDAQGDLTVNGIDPTITNTAFMVNQDIYRILPHGVVLPTITVPVESFDNDHKQHSIPASERQTSWITASLKDHALGSSAPLGYQQPDNKPYVDGTFTFLSQSSLLVDNAGINNPPLNFLGLNIHTTDPINSGSINTLGHPLTAEMIEYHTALAQPAVASIIIGNVSRFLPFPERLGLSQNFDGVQLSYGRPGRYRLSGSLNHVEGQENTGSSTLNALLLRRNGAGGYSSWKQMRNSEHPIARFNKRHNIMTTLTSSRDGRPVHKPDNSFVDYENDKLEVTTNAVSTLQRGLRTADISPVTINKPFVNIVRSLDEQTSIAYSHVNNTEYFPIHYYNENLLTKDQMSRRTLQYEKLRDLPSNPSFGDQSILDLKEVHYTEVIFPKKMFNFLSGNRGRENFAVNYWRNSRYDRAIPAHFFTNSMGMVLAASGSTDDPGASNIPGDFTEGRTSGYGLGAAIHSNSLGSPNSSIWPLDAAIGGGGSALQQSDGGQMCDTTAYLGTLAAFLSTTLTFSDRELISLKPAANTAARDTISGWALPECSDSGELQAAYQIYHMGEISGAVEGTVGLLNSPSSSVRLGQLINRRIMSGGVGATVFSLAGDTKYEAADQAIEKNALGFSGETVSPRGPMYESYEDYSVDLRKIGQGFSIVPEYRISEQIGYYMLSQSQDFSSINTPNNLAFLTLTGSSIPSSKVENNAVDNELFPQHNGNLDVTNVDFIQKYSSADFLRMFEVISSDFAPADLGSPYYGQSDAPTQGRIAPSKITLKCKAVMKFLPYEGFFPVQRAMQIGSMFSASYGDRVFVKGDQAHPRTLFNPLFAPGILYNSLKSGIACDYPIFTAPDVESPTTAQKGQGILRHGFRTRNNDETPDVINDHFGGPKTSGSFDRRLPFETLLNPDKYLLNVNIIDQEPHPSASLNSTASLRGGAINPTYRLAAHNFFSEVVNFYLDSGLTTISGIPDNVTVSFNEDGISGEEANDYANSNVPGLIGQLEGEQSFVVKSFKNSDNEREVKEYRMRVVLRNTNTYKTPGLYASILSASSTQISPRTTDGTDGVLNASGTLDSSAKMFNFTTDPFRSPSVVVYERTGSSPFRFILPNATSSNAPTGTISPNPGIRAVDYVRGSTYGPPHSYETGSHPLAAAFAGALGTMPNYSPYTPAYFNGLGYTEIVFRPETGRAGYYSLDDILGGDFTFIDRRVTEVFNLGTDSSNNGPGNSFLTTGSWISNETHETSMKVSDSIDLLGVREVPGALIDSTGVLAEGTAQQTAKSVVFNTKFECPIFDYSNVKVTGGDGNGGSGVVRGTWHQYGDDISMNIVLPGGGVVENVGLKDGVVLEIQDIPDSEKHTPEATGSLATLLGIPPGPERSKRIGQIKKGIRTVEEAVVAIPYRIEEGTNKEKFFRINPHVLLTLGAMYNNKDEFLGNVNQAGGFAPSSIEAGQGNNEPITNANVTLVDLSEYNNTPSIYEEMAKATNKFSGDLANEEPDPSTRQLIENMKRFVLPPKFNWLDHRLPFRQGLSAAATRHAIVLGESRHLYRYPRGCHPSQIDAPNDVLATAESDSSIGPIVMYIFPFSYNFSSLDMKNMWHNLYPKSCSNIATSELEISHDLLPLNLFGTDKNIGARDLVRDGHKTTFANDVQWMVFKVKQRAKVDYSDVKPSGINKQLYKDGIFNPELDGLTKSARYSYNWPYDYFSLIEKIQLEETLDFNDKTRF